MTPPDRKMYQSRACLHGFVDEVYDGGAAGSRQCAAAVRLAGDGLAAAPSDLLVRHRLELDPQRRYKLLYFKAYKSQLPVIERALETAALMLGSDKSRGYCLEMICADFLAGASLEIGSLDALLPLLTRLVLGLPKPQIRQFLENVQVTL